MSTLDQNTEAAVVADLARQAYATEILPVEGTVAALAAKDGAVTVVDLEQYDAHPRRRRAQRTVYDAKSFAEYLHRHETAATEVYADVQKARIEAVIDANEPAIIDLGGNADRFGYPGWGAHRITLQLTQSPAWEAWTEHDGKMLPQLEFAEFAELHALDVREPSPADLLELAQHLEANRSVAFESGQRLADGQTRLAYKETIEARAGQRGDLEIPTKLRLALKPYIGGPTYGVEAHFRYRLVGPALKLGYVLDRPDVILESAFGDVVEALREGQEATATLPAIEAITAPIFLGRSS